MTPCEKRGYKVGDKFEVLKDTTGFRKGQYVELYRDDESKAPLFLGQNSEYRRCDGKEGAYLNIDQDVKKVNSAPSIESLAQDLAKASKKKSKLATKLDKTNKRFDELKQQLEQMIESETGLSCCIGGDAVACDIPDGVNIDDPETWKEGDVIVCASDKFIDDEKSLFFTEGKEYEFSNIDLTDNSVEVKADDQGDFYGQHSIKFRFVRRP